MDSLVAKLDTSVSIRQIDRVVPAVELRTVGQVDKPAMSDIDSWSDRTSPDGIYGAFDSGDHPGAAPSSMIGANSEGLCD
jgi:hypothetical protein